MALGEQISVLQLQREPKGRAKREETADLKGGGWSAFKGHTLTRKLPQIGGMNDSSAPLLRAITRCIHTRNKAPWAHMTKRFDYSKWTSMRRIHAWKISFNRRP